MKSLKCEIKLIENNKVVESTIIVLSQERYKYIVFDVCGEDIAVDGDDVYEEFANFEEAKQFYEETIQEYKETFESISECEVVQYE